jgi:hypothetical protein
VDSYPGPLFCSIGLRICFCYSTILFLLLWFCSIVWSRVLWYFPALLFLLSIVLTIQSFVFPNDLLGWFFNLCDMCHWGFDGNCIEYVGSFWWYNHFYYVDCTNLWAWELFPFSVVFFDFFL